MRHTIIAAAALLSAATLAVPAGAAPSFHPAAPVTATIQVREANEAPRREDRQQDRQQDRRQDRQQDRRHSMTAPGGFDASGVILVREGEVRGRQDRR